MLKVGITGGIGSGKTLVCTIFSQLGVPVYYADSRAKWLVNNDVSLKESIVEHFGGDAFKDNIYDSKYIGNIVFNDASKLQLLSRIIHPYVYKDWDLFCEQNSHEPIVIKEAAIMLETNSKNTVDKIVLVYSPENLRIQRVIDRDNISEESLRVKMSMQMPEEEKLKLVHYVIMNDGVHSLIEQVRVLYHQLLGSR